MASNIIISPKETLRGTKWNVKAQRDFYTAWLNRADEIARGMGLKGITFAMSHKVPKKGVAWALYGKSRIEFKPEAWLNHMEADLTDTIVHEIAHVTIDRRGDALWAKWLAKGDKKARDLAILLAKENNNHAAAFNREYKKLLRKAIKNVRGMKKLTLGRAGGTRAVSWVPPEVKRRGWHAWGQYKRNPAGFKFALKIAPTKQIVLFETQIQKGSRDLIRAILAQSKKDFATLSSRQRVLRRQLTRTLSDLPFVRGGAGKFVLDLSKNRKINATVRRAFTFLDAYDDASEAAFNVQGFSPHKISKLIALQMRQINKIASNSWQTVLGALKDPSQFGANVVKESREIIRTQRLLQRKLNVILKNQLQKSTYGKASNVIALLSEA